MSCSGTPCACLPLPGGLCTMEGRPEGDEKVTIGSRGLVVRVLLSAVGLVVLLVLSQMGG